MRVIATVAALVLCLAVAAGDACAKEGDKSVEGTLDYGTESFEDLGGQFGVTAGFGYEFLDNLQGRIDLSYYRSSTDMGGMNVTGTRVPVDFGVRYLFPLAGIDRNLAAYGQGGVEISFDEWEAGAGLASSSETRFGVLIGGGAEYALAPRYGAIFNLQYHVIEGGYLSAGIGMAYHF